MSSVGASATVAGSSPRPGFRSAVEPGQGRRLREGASPPLVAVVAGAWTVLLVGHASGVAHHVDHDAILRGGEPSFSGVALFLAGWAVMVVAMMFPTALAALGRPTRAVRAAVGPPFGDFLAGFLLVWVVAGAAALGMDAAVHRAVHEVPVLEARPWLVASALLAVAGVAQLTPSTRRHLANARLPVLPGATTSALVAGREHGIRCVRADGPLVLVMFAAGSHFAWMLALTVVMAGERSTRAGRHVSVTAGVALLAGTLLTAWNPLWLPGPLALNT